MLRLHVLMIWDVLSGGGGGDVGNGALEES